MPPLPIELWMNTMQHHCKDADHAIESDNNTLMACALVCSSFRVPAQTLLFQSVGRDIYGFPWKRDSFEATIHPSTERGRILGSYVRNLQVNLDHTFNYADGTLDMRRFTLLLSWCPRLYELSLHVYDIRKFNEVELAELQFIANTVQLRALRLLRFVRQSTLIYQFISVWPTIQYLTVGSESDVPHYLGRIFATVASKTLSLPIYDTQCGAKIFKVTPELTHVLAQPFLSRWIFDVEIVARYLQRCGREFCFSSMYEFPLDAWEDVGGSKLRPFDFFYAAFDIFRIHRRYLSSRP